MAGVDFVFNISLGGFKGYFGLAAANDAIILALLEATGLEADGTLRDHDTLASLLAGTSNEQTTMGRKTITAGFTITVDDTNNRLDIDAADQIYTAAAGSAVGKAFFGYDDDTTGGTDANIVPISAHSLDITPDGSDVTIQVAAAGLLRATG